MSDGPKEIPATEATDLRYLEVVMNGARWAALPPDWPKEPTPEQKAEAVRLLNAAALVLGAHWHRFPTIPMDTGPELD